MQKLDAGGEMAQPGDTSREGDLRAERLARRLRRNLGELLVEERGEDGEGQDALPEAQEDS